MPDRITITVKGLPELQQELKRFSSAVQTRLARNAAMAMARVVAKHARLKAPSRRIRASIKARRDPAQGSTRRLVAFANARHPLSAIFEYGKGLPRYTKRGRYTGIMTPHPFLRPALDENHVEIYNKLLENLTIGLERERRKQIVADDPGEV